MAKYLCINVFRDKVANRYVQPGELVDINGGRDEEQRLIAANCIRPLPEGPRQAPPAPPQRESPQGPTETPAVETAAVEAPEKQARTGRPRGRRRRS